jgi:hypothetical protein
MAEQPSKNPPVFEDYGIDPALSEIQNFKAEIVFELKKAQVPFPITSREQLMTIFPKGRFMQCSMKGQKIDLHEYITKMKADEFPMKTAGEVADKVASSCTL